MSLKRSLFYTFLTQAPTLLLYFISSTLITRLLGDTGRGEYALLTNQAAWLYMLFSLNIGLGITYFTSKGGSADRSIVGTASTMVLANVVVMALVLFAISRSFDLTDLMMPDGRTHLGYWAFIYLSGLLSLINNAVSAVLLGLKQFRFLNAMGILNAVMSAVGFALFYLVRDQFDPQEILPYVLAFSAVIMILQTLGWIVLYAVQVGVAPVPVWNWSVLRPILAFSSVSYLANLINLINYRFDVWVVERYEGAASLGVYAVAVGVAQLLFYIPDPLARVVQPYLYGQIKDEMLARFKSVARLNFTAVLGSALALIILAPWIIPLIYGEVFSASVLSLQLLLPGIVFSSTTKLLAPLVVQGGAQRFNLFAIAVGAVITIILDLLLIPIWGIVGAAVTTTLVYFVIMAIVLAVIRYRFRIPVHDLFLVQRSDISQVLGLGAASGSHTMMQANSQARPRGRVLCVVGWWPKGADAAGVFVREHVEAVARMRSVMVLHMDLVKSNSLWPRITQTTDIENGIPVVRVLIETPLRRFDMAERLVRRTFRRLIRQWHKEDPFDVVHIHVRTEVTAEALSVATELDLPVVLTEHYTFYHQGIRQLPAAQQQKQRQAIRSWLAHPNLKAVMPVSHDLARILRDEYGVSESKITVVPNIAAEMFKPGKEPEGAPFRMMLAAIWRPPKDHDVFIKALGLLPREVLENCRVDWVGYGPEYALIQKRCAVELPRVDIRFTGYLDKIAMAQLMRNSHLFVLPTMAENLPCVVIESLACGTPVVSMDLNGLPELVNASNGILVPPGDPQALAQALLTCIQERARFDRTSVAHEARSRFSAAVVTGQIIDVYMNVQATRDYEVKASGMGTTA